MADDAFRLVAELVAAATPVIRIYGVGDKPWCRRVKQHDKRLGPWRELRYSILDNARWATRAPCLYLVMGDDGGNRYVGVSDNQFRQRWRLSPALEPKTGVRLQEKQLFHSQCTVKIEEEFSSKSGACFFVHVILEDELAQANGSLRNALVSVPRSAGKSWSRSVESWLRCYKGEKVARWNAT